MKQLARLMIIALVSVFVLAGCGKKETKPEDTDTKVVVEEKEEKVEKAAEVVEEKIEESQGFQVHPLDDPDSALAQRKIYFDFDRSEIRPEFRDVIAAHAEFLANNPLAAVTLEGHCDERGTREYNMALGERRANSVMELLTLQGASRSQIKSISYGEERPEELGHNESAWAKNRRVVMVYTSR